MNFRFTIEDLLAKKRTSIQHINVIKQWLPTTTESYIPSSIHDELIALFLMSRQNDIDLTKECIKSHYGLRYEAPEMFDGRNLERIDIQKALNTLRLVSIPRRTEDNYLVLYASVRDTDFFSFELHPIMTASLMLFDIEHHTHPPDGVIILADLKGFGVMHVFKLWPESLRKFFTYLGRGLPYPFIGLHFINGNFFLAQLINILVAIIDPDIVRRVSMLINSK
ncbi:uncharacterized protein LOC114341543 [Diabrotica virgifera virgifera]|uniref:CRAL-TRIO domain-containing protein n=1 Tax=Diabrotica virgifera virgifera TaxID=50390 RepID=A0ABM5KTG1_DIAVI|nr:uncharacterized protein LOC114341543 [Diabrotica virgifera virgifera]